MSALVELNGKAGRVCPQGQSGEIRCPCIVRTTSEDVLTGEVFGQLRHVRPHLWLTPLLNLGLDNHAHRQAWYKNLSIRLWERQERFPPELLGFKEGRSEPDVIVEWDNPATSLWIEAKFTSPLAAGTTYATENDQVIRGIRTLLAATGHVSANRLFSVPRRRPIWLALLTYKPEPLVDGYRDRSQLVQGLKGTVAEDVLPILPFVGTLTWHDVAWVLHERATQMTPAERSVSKTLGEYIEHKMSFARKAGLPVFPKPVDHTSSHPSRMFVG